MLRSLLFVSFQGCYYLCDLPTKVGSPETRVDPGDALNEERFHDWIQTFQEQIKGFKKGHDVSNTLKDLERYCDDECQSEFVTTGKCLLKWTFSQQTEHTSEQPGPRISSGLSTDAARQRWQE